MKVGDIVQWSGANRIIKGEVVEEGECLYIKLNNRKLFRPEDVSGSKTFKILDPDPWAFLNE